MIKSAPFIVSSSPTQTKEKRPWFGVVLSRLLLLVIGSGLAGVAGSVAAVFYPDLNPEMPLAVKMLERLKNGTQATSLGQNPAPASASANSPLAAASQGGNAAQVQQLMTQVQQLQGEMQALRDRTQVLENTLGSPRPSEPLETRLQAIAQQLQAAPQRVPPVENGNSPSQGQAEALKITLPSDILFLERDVVLSSGANLILDKVISDLRNYPNTTISVAVHTDNTAPPDESRDISFQRARSLEQYLSMALGKQHRLLVIGYGSSRPLVLNLSDADRQRNRRVEITVNAAQ